MTSVARHLHPLSVGLNAWPSGRASCRRKATHAELIFLEIPLDAEPTDNNTQTSNNHFTGVDVEIFLQ